jgi:hypothetical protein
VSEIELANRDPNGIAPNSKQWINHHLDSAVGALSGAAYLPIRHLVRDFGYPGSSSTDPPQA